MSITLHLRGRYFPVLLWCLAVIMLQAAGCLKLVRLPLAPLISPEGDDLALIFISIFICIFLTQVYPILGGPALDLTLARKFSTAVAPKAFGAKAVTYRNFLSTTAEPIRHIWTETIRFSEKLWKAWTLSTRLNRGM